MGQPEQHLAVFWVSGYAASCTSQKTCLRHREGEDLGLEELVVTHKGDPQINIGVKKRDLRLDLSVQFKG